MTKPILTQTPFEAHHPNALAIYCSDGRFTRAVEELLRELGHERLDTLTMPGGPALLNLWSSSYTQSDAMEKSAQFLIEGHKIVHVVLLAHQGCGYYKAQYKARSAEEIMHKQIEDLRFGERALKKGRHELEISMFYARAVKDRVVFEHVV